MASICFISPFHPANNPRLVRAADALADAGHEVRAVMTRFDPRWASLEKEITSRAKWRFQAVDYLWSRSGRLRWQMARITRRLAGEWVKHSGCRWAHENALGYGIGPLARLAAAVRSDLFIAHTHTVLGVGVRVAGRQRAAVGFDAEDLLADRRDRFQRSHEWIERTYFHRCDFVTTMSQAAADFLRQKHQLREAPLALHNSVRLCERDGLKPPQQRPFPAVPSLYWYGQTIGSHARAEQVIRAMPLVPHRFRYVLRGNEAPSYIKSLRALAVELGVGDRIEFAPVAPPNRLTMLAAEHDMMMGAQPGQEPFNQCAIGNKVMTAAAAGLALLLTDTAAHRRLLKDAPGIGALFPDNDPAALAKVISSWLENRQELRAVQARAWEAGSTLLNWDTESRALVTKVAQVLERRTK